MNLFHSDKDICFRIRVSHENQEKLQAQILSSASPLFSLKRDHFYSIRLEYKSFACTYQGKKQEFSYRDVEKIETVTDGLIIYLSNGKYVSIATEAFEKHNSELYDIAVFLKKHNRKRFFEREKIVFPDDTSERYTSEKEPIAKISFELSGQEIAHLLWYEYLIDEKMLALIIPTMIGFFLAIVLQNVWIAILSGFVTILMLPLLSMHLKYKDSYIHNHQGRLYAFLYDDLLVVRLHTTDLELEYHSMTRLKNLFGLWRMKSGDFFVLTLPKRIVEENALFFDELYKKTNKRSAIQN